LLLFSVLTSEALATGIVPLNQGWEYRWGDSPWSSTGAPLWTLEAPAADWTPIDFPSNPPGRQGRSNIWYRVPLPPLDWRDPALYIFSIDLLAEVYLHGQRLYHFGMFEPDGHGQFAGWPWHLIPLPRDAGGQWLYFRIFSDYKDIGLWGEILLGERIELLQRLLNQSTERLITSGLSLLIALLALAFAPLGRGTRGFGAIALFAYASGIMLLSGAPAVLLIVNRPLLWEFLGAGGYYLIPVAMAWLLQQWLYPATSRLLRVLIAGHLLYLGGALGLAGLGWISLADTYPVFDLLFALTLVLMLLPTARLVRDGGLEQRLILATIALLVLLLLLDMAVAHGLLPWASVPLAWGVLGFSLAIVLISLRHFARTQRALESLNRSLEQQVQARTAELELALAREAQRAQHLDVLSYEDGLTGLKNRRFLDERLAEEIAVAERQAQALTLVICDVDHFKRFNDTHGHAAGDVALQQVAAHLSRVFRDTDTVCRYGGEEFVVLMPGAAGETAQARCETLRQQVAADPLPDQGRALGPITLSLGIASYPQPIPEARHLMRLADQALYRAKQNGRNRIEQANPA
jgi:diguanylate cyclase (GGDEF)-like protein